MPKEKKDQLKILVIVGTVRENRVGRKIGEWYLKEAQRVAPEINFELFDVAEQNLPIFHEPHSPLLHKYSKTQERLAKIIGAADGFIFVTGEYNHTIPGSLKNFLDHLFAEWNYKAAAYVGYGSTGGIRAIEHLIPVMAELKVASVANTFNDITIPTVWNALDESGRVKPDMVKGDISKQLEDLKWWVATLKVGREQKKTA